MKKPALLIALSTLASASIFAPSSAHAFDLVSVPLYFPSQTGGFSSPFKTAPGSTTVSAGFSGAGSGTTATFNPLAHGIKATNISSVIFSGILDYNGTTGSSLFANLLSNGSIVQSIQLASGATNITNSPFSLDLTQAVSSNINTNFAAQFVGTGNFTSSHKLVSLQVQNVPEPFTILGSVVAVGFGSFLRKKYSRQLNKQAVS